MKTNDYKIRTCEVVRPGCGFYPIIFRFDFSNDKEIIGATSIGIKRDCTLREMAETFRVWSERLLDFVEGVEKDG